MRYHPTNRDRLDALRISGIYAFFSAAWIYLSDMVLASLNVDPAVFVRYSVYKGLAFIAATTLLIFYLISRYTAERGRVELELKRLTEELEARVAERTLLLIQQSRMAAMGEVLMSIAHHWRQPLNVIGLKVQQLGFSFDLGEFSEEILRRNVAETMEILQRLSRTIDDIHVLTAPDREVIRFSVAKTLADVVSLVDQARQEAGVTIESHCDGDPPQLDGYPNQFSHVLLNILMNSLEAFQERGATGGRIQVRTVQKAGKVVVIITDNAGGIGDEILDRIFDPFFTTKKRNGGGIGLFIAKNAIEKGMNGRLTVRNVEGGAEFRIEVEDGNRR